MTGQTLQVKNCASRDAQPHLQDMGAEAPEPDGDRRDEQHEVVVAAAAKHAHPLAVASPPEGVATESMIHQAHLSAWLSLALQEVVVLP